MSLDLASSKRPAPVMVSCVDGDLLRLFSSPAHPLSDASMRSIVLAPTNKEHYLYWSQNELSRLSPERFDFLCSLIQRSPSIRQIDLSYCNIGSLPAQRLLQLAEALAASPNLGSLMLNDNHFDKTHPDVLIAAFSRLAASPSLRILSLFGNYIRHLLPPVRAQLIQLGRTQLELRS